MSEKTLRKSPSGPEVEVETPPITSDEVTNESEVPGETVTDALNSFVLSEFDAGPSGAAITIDFAANGPLQLLTLDQNCVLTITPPPSAKLCLLRIVNGGAFNLTLPAGTKVAGGPYTPTANGEDIMTWYWKGSLAWRVAVTKDFQ